MSTEMLLWLFGAYLAGSGATYFLFLKQNFKNATEATIDALIEKGFLRHKKTSDGEVEILKWNAADE